MDAIDDIKASSEYEIFTVAVRWIIHDVQERIKHSIRIMSQIRFAQMSQEELFMCAETTSLVRGYDKFREMILVANWILTTVNEGRSDSFDFPRPAARKCFINQKKHEDIPTSPKVVMPPPVMTSTPKSEKSPSPAETHSATDLREPTITQAMVHNVKQEPDESPETEATQNDDVTQSSAGVSYQIVAEKQKVLTGEVLPTQTDLVDILVVGGFQAEQTFTPTDVEKYDVEDNQWLHFCGLPSPRRHHSVVTEGEHIYMIGGCEPYGKNTIPEPTNTVYSMTITSKQWIPIASMIYDRYSHGACTVNGIIYVVGGKSKYTVLDSMECYDAVTDSWLLTSSLPEPIYDAAVASLKSKIYVVGGLTHNDLSSTSHVVSSVYCFDTTTEGWTKLNDVRFGRCQSSLVNVNDRLYLCGGATNAYNLHNTELASTSNIDEYDHDNDKWTHVSDMVIPRHDMGVAVAGSRIYMIGGITTPADRVLQSIECYDVTSQAWISGVQDLPYPARWICCCSVKCKYQKPVSVVDV
ncbi:hypothetical protein ACF0H5_014479 [Mactra antiquata]